MRRIACLVALAALALPVSALAQTITVDLTFPDKALAELIRIGEGVHVSAYWMGDPAPGATLRLNEIERVFLMSEGISLHPGPARLVLGGSLAAAPMDQVIEPFANINVSSDRWDDEYNLLDCGFLDDTLAVLSAAPQTIHCKLIGE